jgi:hypothetical protein
MRRLVSALSLAAPLVLFACGGSPSEPARAPVAAVRAEPPAKTSPRSPFDIGVVSASDEIFPSGDPPPIDVASLIAAKAAEGVTPPPPTCAAFAARKSFGAAPKDADASLAALALALRETDVGKRDALLVALETAPGMPGGLVRALRADLAPVECADVVVDPLLSMKGTAIPGHVLHALVGQSLAARLARTVTKAPPLAPPYSRVRVIEYIRGPLRIWISGQAKAIDEISRAGSKLASYGKAIVAIEAGLADMRFVERVRELPLPTEFAKDEELKAAYFASLDQVLDPRKDRGRDAALLGLREFASIGALHDARVERARVLLGKLYAGRRIDALDALLLPALAEAMAVSQTEQLAASLPTFYSAILLDPTSVSNEKVLRAFLERGVPAPMRAALVDPAGLFAALPSPGRELYARARLELGKTYWRSMDFERAAAISGSAGASRNRSEEGTLVLAVAMALRAGPKDAVEMMRAPSPEALNLRQVEALDAIAESTGKYAGMAAFDAALLLSTSPPEGAHAPYFLDVARRFHAAASRLTDVTQKAQAEERAHTAEAIASATK